MSELTGFGGMSATRMVKFRLAPRLTLLSLWTGNLPRQLTLKRHSVQVLNKAPPQTDKHLAMAKPNEQLCSSNN